MRRPELDNAVLREQTEEGIIGIGGYCGRTGPTAAGARFRHGIPLSVWGITQTEVRRVKLHGPPSGPRGRIPARIKGLIGRQGGGRIEEVAGYAPDAMLDGVGGTGGGAHGGGGGRVGNIHVTRLQRGAQDTMLLRHNAALAGSVGAERAPHGVAALTGYAFEAVGDVHDGFCGRA